MKDLPTSGIGKIAAFGGLKSVAPSKSNTSYHQFLDYTRSLSRSISASSTQLLSRVIQGENYFELEDYGILSTGNSQGSNSLKLSLCACSACRYQGEVGSYPNYSDSGTNSGGLFQNYSDPGVFLGGASSTFPDVEWDAWNTLNSRPGAQYAVFLDFDGYYSSNSIWEAKGRRGGELELNSFFEGWDGSNTTEEIFNAISLIHRRVSEDFNFLDVNVTTDWNQVIGLDTDSWVGAVFTDNYNLATGRSIKNAGGGGTAYLGSFDNVSGYDEPVLIFNGYNNTSFSSIYAAAETASHEVGHSLDLQHDGTSTSSYWGGDDGVDETSFAAIMGASFIDNNENVTRWSDGNYADANQTQDDIAIMAEFLAVAKDEEGDDFATAIVIENNNPYKGSIGVNINESNEYIEYVWDYDYFYIDRSAISASGLSISAVNASTVYYSDSSSTLNEFDQTVYGPNLDIWAELHLVTSNQGGSFEQLSSYTLNVSDSLSLNLNLDLTSIYYNSDFNWLSYLDSNPSAGLFLSLHGGNGPQGTTTSQDSQDLNYGSEYGSLGEYQLTISGYDAPDPDPGTPILNYSLVNSSIPEEGSTTLTISLDPNGETSLEPFWLDFTASNAIYNVDFLINVDHSQFTADYNEQEKRLTFSPTSQISAKTVINVTIEALPDDDEQNETLEFSLKSDGTYDLPAAPLLLTIVDNDIQQQPISTEIISGQNILWDELTGQQYFLDSSPFGLDSYASSSSPTAFDPTKDSSDIVQVVKTEDMLGQWYGVSKYSLDGVNGLALFYDPDGQTNIETSKGPDESDDLVAFISGWTVRGKTFLYGHDDPDYATWIDVVDYSPQV